MKIKEKFPFYQHEILLLALVVSGLLLIGDILFHFDIGTLLSRIIILSQFLVLVYIEIRIYRQPWNIEITDHQVIKISALTKKRTVCAVDLNQVQNISRMPYGRIRLTFNDKKVLTLTLKEQDVPAVWAHLTAHVPAACTVVEKEQSTLRKVLVSTGVAVEIFFIFYMLASGVNAVFKQYVFESPFSRIFQADIQKGYYSDDATFWYLDRPFLSRAFRLNQIEADGTKRSWQTPDVTPGESSDLGLMNVVVLGIGMNSQKQPVMITENTMYRWNGQDWQENNLEFDGNSSGGMVISGTTAWYFKDSGDRLGKLDLDSGEVSQFPLPQEEFSRGGRINKIFVREENLYAQVDEIDRQKIFVLRGSTWQELFEIWYPDYSLYQFALDAEENFWAIYPYDPSTVVKWDAKTFEVSRYSTGLTDTMVNAMGVDANGRLWTLSDWNENQLMVFEEKGDAFNLVQQYDHFNSSILKNPREQRVEFQNSRIWLLGNGVEYLDTTRPDLPAPAPEIVPRFIISAVNWLTSLFFFQLVILFGYILIWNSTLTGHWMEDKK